MDQNLPVDVNDEQVDFAGPAGGIEHCYKYIGVVHGHRLPDQKEEIEAVAVGASSAELEHRVVHWCSRLEADHRKVEVSAVGDGVIGHRDHGQVHRLVLAVFLAAGAFEDSCLVLDVHHDENAREQERMCIAVLELFRGAVGRTESE